MGIGSGGAGRAPPRRRGQLARPRELAARAGPDGRRQSVHAALVDHLLAVGHQHRREHRRDHRHGTGRHPGDSARRPCAHPPVAPDRGSFGRRARQQVHGRATAVGDLRGAAGRRSFPVLRGPGHVLARTQEFLTGAAPTDRTRPGRARPCCSPTSSAPRHEPASSATGGGAGCWRSTTTVVRATLARFRGREVETTRRRFPRDLRRPRPGDPRGGRDARRARRG